MFLCWGGGGGGGGGGVNRMESDPSLLASEIFFCGHTTILNLRAVIIAHSLAIIICSDLLIS